MSWRKKQDENLHIKTGKAIVIGFDADVNECGIAAYNAATDEIRYIGTMHYNDISDWIDRFIDEHGKIKMVARVEQATFGTVRGASKGLNIAGIMKLFWHSGRSSVIAELFINLMERKNIPVLKVESTKRLKFDKYKALPAKSMFSNVLAALGKGKIPSKMSASHIKHLFPQIDDYKKENRKAKLNSESFDALCLCLKERFVNMSSYKRK